jgi:hypothetical protein
MIVRDRWPRLPGSFDPSEKMTGVAGCVEVDLAAGPIRHWRRSLIARGANRVAEFRSSAPVKFWSGRRESNPRMQLGKLPFCH